MSSNIWLYSRLRSLLRFLGLLESGNDEKAASTSTTPQRQGQARTEDKGGEGKEPQQISDQSRKNIPGSVMVEDLSRNERVQRAGELRDMVALSPGWKHVRAIVDAMRREAFEAWANSDETTNLPKLKMKEKALTELLDRINLYIEDGIVAKNEMEREARYRESLASEPDFGTSDVEINRLLGNKKEGARTPQGAASGV